jgi:Zn-finger nucleic acid-binding protein
MPSICPVCDSVLINLREYPNGRDVSIFSCPRCGDFALSRSLVASLPTILASQNDASAKISHALRKMQQENKTPELDTGTVEAIIRKPLPRPREQADLLIRWLAENSPEPGKTVWVEPSTHSSIIGAKSAGGFALVLRHLFKAGLVEGSMSDISNALRTDVALTFNGWDHYEDLRQGQATYRKAFMAMKFGDPILDKVMETVFKPSAKRAGFDLIRLDDAPRAGLIDDRLRVEIQASDFVLADLTHENLGAYWEAGYAEGLGKPVIYTCEKEHFNAKSTHFDTNHHLTILWDKEIPHAIGDRLTATIRATLPQRAIQED